MIYEIDAKKPVIDASAFIAPSADIIGDVKIGQNSSVWFGTVVRGDGFPVVIGKNSNIQDNCVIHVTTGKNASIIADNVTIAHNVVIHGARLENFAFVGMSATVMDKAIIHEYGMVAAGALVPPGFKVPARTLVAGVPARVIRELKDDEIKMIESSAEKYAANASLYRSSLKPFSGFDAPDLSC